MCNVIWNYAYKPVAVAEDLMHKQNVHQMTKLIKSTILLHLQESQDKRVFAWKSTLGFRYQIQR